MSARLLEDFTEISCDWFWEMDENLKFSYFSYRWRVLFGRLPEQEIGKSRLDVALNADDKAFWQPHIDDLLARRPFRDLIYPYRFEDGHIRWLKVSGQPVVDSQGVFAGYRGVGTDITEEHETKRRLSETLEELRHANRAYTLVNAELQRQNERLIAQESELSAQATRLAATFDNMHQGLLMLDGEHKATAFNSKFTLLLGFASGFVREGVTARELLSEAFRLGHYLGRDFDEMYARWLNRLSKRQASVHRQLLADGRVLSVAYVPMADAGWVITYEDVTERERADTAIREQRHQLDAALNNMAHGLCMFDDQLRVLVYNQRYIEMFRFSPQFVRPGITLRQLLEQNVAIGNVSGPAEQIYQEYLTELKQHGSLSIQREHLDGRTIAISHRPMADGGWVATYEDITEQKQAEAKILQLARQDALTKLPNRMLFGEKMNEALARVRRGEKLAVLCLDLDHFKTVNDTLGHSAGDALLKIVAERLQDCVRETDTVARLGGDEFAVLLVGVEEPEEISIVASRIIASLGAPYDLEGHDVLIGTSIGTASAPKDAVDAETLLKNADMALYRAKEDGGGVCRFFAPAMDAYLQRQRELELDLRRAIEDDRFALFYQPLVDARSGEITGFEALLRWCDQERGMVDPSEFIPLAEEIGVIGRLGEWAIRTACADASTWPKRLKVAVNLSPAQFRSKTLTHTVISALGASGLTPQRLELEITESVLLQKNDETLAILHQLRGLGVHIVMDDFGTGYSSLNYLRSFPFDRIKIDRAFVQDIGQKADCTAILTAIAGLGASLGIATTAEGVETPEQLKAVRDLGYTEVQGFLFGEPQPASQVAELIAGGSIRAA